MGRVGAKSVEQVTWAALNGRNDLGDPFPQALN